MTPVLDVRGLAKSHGSRTLLAGTDLAVDEGEKVGVIGRNGTGKSTLFRLVASLESPDEGTVALRRGARVGYLAQDPEMDPSSSVVAAVEAGRPGLDALLAEYDRVNAALAGGGAWSEPEQAELLERQSRLTTRIDAEGGWDRGHRVEGILTRLGITGWDRPLHVLSGGERRRVALARTLLSEPDLLLLDEPTNHLDADTVLWLEETLFDFGGAALLVTHDRYFLDRVVDRIVELRKGCLSSFRGGYTEYLEERALREERERAEDRKRARLVEKELAWARRSPPARTGKQKARRERARELSAEKGRRDSIRSRGLQAETAEGPRLGRTVVELHDVSKAYGSRLLLDGVSERILAGECVGVVGPNGVGKSTLLRLVVGEEAPDSGRVVLGETVRVGYLDQSRSLDPEKSVARTVSDADWVEVGGRRTHLRAYLDRFLFPAHVHEQKARALSGGERTRLLLARLLLEEFNLLLLDEPTNDLDLDTLHVLEDVIERFDGSVLVVTHDRYLLDKLVTSLLVFEGEGRVRRHHGSWDAYLVRRDEETATERERLRERERRQRTARREAAKQQAREARSGRDRLSYKEARELEALEERIIALEEEAGELSARLADPAFYQDDPDAVGGVSRRLGQVEEEAAELYERWAALGERT